MQSIRRRFLLKHFNAAIQSLHPHSILEIGAGEVQNLRTNFPPSVQYKTLDPNPEMKAHYVGFGEEVVFTEKFDLIVALEVLEHVYDPDKFLSNLKSALHPGGTILLSVPFLTPIHMEWDYWRFTHMGLEKLLKKYFSSVTVHAMGSSKDAILQQLHMQYRKRALIFLKPVMFICLSLLERFKIEAIGSTTGYFAVIR